MIFFERLPKDEILKEYDLEEAKNKKIICYLPTHRDVRKVDEDYFIFQKQKKILKCLQENDIFILQKKSLHKS